MIITVNTKDLRQALASVIPHAHEDPDTKLNRLRCTATGDMLYVQATNTVTAGLAAVSVWDADDISGSPDDDVFDLTVSTAKKILAIFKASKKQPEDELGEAMTITVSDSELTFVDTGGLFPGESFSQPTGEVDGAFPNLPRLFAESLTDAKQVPDRLVANGMLLRKFATAATTYGDLLVIEPTGDSSRILISCGESFIGALMPMRVEAGGELAADLKDAHEGWMNRLPALAAAIASTRG
ncbi:hypothetical protein [Zhihengliuella sp.]|uniref:hypothetical protein n=1 Tax=Zhihengliuella sp. TaxID=1954483 RepID=UPI0028119727|nr:hypothetical protein [Zhihengliuella sp.]